MRHRFEVVKDEAGAIKYKCKRCGNVYKGSYPTRIPCRAVINEVGKGGKDE